MAKIKLEYIWLDGYRQPKILEVRQSGGTRIFKEP
jgi:hypothetical protein